MGEINLTPMMDLTFVLLITFIITFPLIEAGVPIAVPAGEASELEADESAITLSLDAEKTVFINNIPIVAADLLLRLEQRKRENPEVEVWLRADEGLPYGDVMEVIKLVQKAKIGNMSLVTDGTKERDG